jgi:hypothetical protein
MKLLKYTIELTESDVTLFDELQNILPKYKLIYEDLRERIYTQIETS